MSCCQKKSTAFIQEKNKLLLFNLNGYQNTFIYANVKTKLDSILQLKRAYKRRLFIPRWIKLFLSFSHMQTAQSSFLDWVTFFRRAEIAFKITLVAKWEHMSGSKVSPLSARFPTAENSSDCSLRDVWKKSFLKKWNKCFSHSENSLGYK